MLRRLTTICVFSFAAVATSAWAADPPKSDTAVKGRDWTEICAKSVIHGGERRGNDLVPGPTEANLRH